MLFLFFFVNTMYNQQSKFIHHGQSLQFALHCLPFLRAQPQRAAAHPPQRLQARGCASARRRVRRGVLLHVGLRERHARLFLNPKSETCNTCTYACAYTHAHCKMLWKQHNILHLPKFTKVFATTYNECGRLRVAERCFFAIWPVDARLVPRLLLRPLLRRNAVPMMTSRSAFVIMDLIRFSLLRIFSLMLDIVEARLGETLDLLLDFLLISVLENPTSYGRLLSANGSLLCTLVACRPPM